MAPHLGRGLRKGRQTRQQVAQAPSLHVRQRRQVNVRVVPRALLRGDHLRDALQQLRPGQRRHLIKDTR